MVPGTRVRVHLKRRPKCGDFSVLGSFLRYKEHILGHTEIKKKRVAALIKCPQPEPPNLLNQEHSQLFPEGQLPRSWGARHGVGPKEGYPSIETRGNFKLDRMFTLTTKLPAAQQAYNMITARRRFQQPRPFHTAYMRARAVSQSSASSIPWMWRLSWDRLINCGVLQPYG